MASASCGSVPVDTGRIAERGSVLERDPSQKQKELVRKIVWFRSWKKASGGWSQREKRRCQRSLSCRMRSKAQTWTSMAKAASDRQKKDLLKERVGKGGEEIKSPKRKVIRVESEETQD